MHHIMTQLLTVTMQEYRLTDVMEGQGTRETDNGSKEPNNG